ncbi:NAD(P)-dependent oxidoreductase [Candidatus Microgenomates bacterium]|nr:NAD(P)-dependent oxidoreductase [Candidatus Microgenomates bacterium]
MIIGHGDIASVLKDRKDFIFFASGVSNSGETRESEYKREEDVLMKQNKNKHLVYFGSLCIFYSNSRYARHKKYMEELVKTHFKHYTIVRMGNITWGKNPHTLINYFRNAKKKGKKLEIWDTYRYLVDKEEFLHWITMIPDWNCEMNITGKKLKVKQIIENYVRT